MKNVQIKCYLRKLTKISIKLKRNSLTTRNYCHLQQNNYVNFPVVKKLSIILISIRFSSILKLRLWPWSQNTTIARKLEYKPLITVHNNARVNACTKWAKKWPNLFLSELRRTSNKFDNLWHTDSKDDEITWGTLIFHSPNCYITWWLSVSDCSSFHYQFDRVPHDLIILWYYIFYAHGARWPSG